MGETKLLTAAGAASAAVSASVRLHLQGPEAGEYPATSLWPYHADRLRPVLQQWHDNTYHPESRWQAARCPGEFIASLSVFLSHFIWFRSNVVGYSINIFSNRYHRFTDFIYNCV